MKENFKKVLNLFLEKKIYLIILTLFFIVSFLCADSFDEDKNTLEYKYVDEIAGGRTPSLEKDIVISQKFIANANRLSSISIRTFMPGVTLNSNINVKVVELDRNIQIVNQDCFIGGFQEGDYIEINIPTQYDSYMKEYEIIFTGLDGVFENSFQFAYSTDKSDYLCGTFVNGELQENNLALKLTYHSSKTYMFYIFLWIFVYVISCIYVVFIMNNEVNEKSFLKLAIVLGGFFILFTPIFHNLDEWDHYFRTLMISQGNIYDEIDSTGVIGGTIPNNVQKNIQVYKGDRGISLKNFWFKERTIFEKFSSDKSFVYNQYFSNRIPLGYFIPSIGVLIGRVIFNNFFLSVVLGRLAVYIFYCTFTYIAIKNLKYYKKTMFIIATIPVTFWLSGTISTDPILNASSFMFISICLKHLCNKNEDKRITCKEIFLLVISAIFLISCKHLVGIPILLLFFFIPKKKFNNKQYIILMLLAILIGITLLFWQQFLNVNFNCTEDRVCVSPSLQLEFVKNNFEDFISIFIQESFKKGSIWLNNFTYDGVLTGVSNSTGLIMVLVALLEENKNEELKNNKLFNILSVLIFLIIFLSTLFVMYLSFTSVGKNAIDGFQNRYFIIALPLLLIPMSNYINIKNNIENYNSKLLFIVLIMNLDLIFGEIVKAFSIYKFN